MQNYKLFLIISIFWICSTGLSQDFEWGHSFGGPGMDRGESICTDQNGNVYYAGFYEDSAEFN